MIPLVRTSKRELAARLLARSGLGLLLRWFWRRQGVLTLAYHRISSDWRTPFDRELWSATPEGFDSQVRLLKTNFDVIGPGDLPAVLRRRSGRYALITFDDGYRDNYQVAFPILKAHHVTATFFVSTGFMDRPRPSWFDEVAWMVRASRRGGMPGRAWMPGPVPFDEPDRAGAVAALAAVYKRLPGDQTGAYLDFVAEATGSGRCPAAAAAGTWMTWDMLREMSDAGMSVGGHTASHPVLSRLPREQQRTEILECQQRIEAELGRPMTAFSYPDGKPAAFDDDSRDLLAYSGVEFAFSYYGGFLHFDDWDPYDIPRVAVERYTTPEMFKATLTLPQLFS